MKLKSFLSLILGALTIGSASVASAATPTAHEIQIERATRMAEIQKVEANTPFYFDNAVKSSMTNNRAGTVNWHTSHVSHASHASHASHMSHRSSVYY